jgi:hypothetical protein
MNNRIKELALQSADEIADLFNPGFFDDRMLSDVAEINKKFAELIVRECADIAQQHNKSPVAAPLAIGYVIREHFGVEE